MLTAEEAKKIGIRSCVDKIGYEFCKQHADTAVCSDGEEDGIMKCYVGIDDKPEQPYDIESLESIILDDAKYMPYYANCEVNMQNGKIEFSDCCLPES